MGGGRWCEAGRSRWYGGRCFFSDFFSGFFSGFLSGLFSGGSGLSLAPTTRGEVELGDGGAEGRILEILIEFFQEPLTLEH